MVLLLVMSRSSVYTCTAAAAAASKTYYSGKVMIGTPTAVIRNRRLGFLFENGWVPH